MILSVVISLPAWRIKNIQVFGTNIISRKYIEKMAKSFIGENIFLADYSLLKKNFRNIHQIKDFGIWRKLPSTLVVKVIERESFAVAIISGSSVVIDEDGFFLEVEGKRLVKGDYSFINVKNISDLPVVKGIDKTKTSQNRLNQDVAQAIKIAIGELSRFLSSSRLQLEMRREGDFNLLVEDVLKVRFGSTDNIERKISVLEAILPEVEGKWSDVSYIDIRIASNPVIKYKKNKNT